MLRDHPDGKALPVLTTRTAADLQWDRRSAPHTRQRRRRARARHVGDPRWNGAIGLAGGAVGGMLIGWLLAGLGGGGGPLAALVIGGLLCGAAAASIRSRQNGSGPTARPRARAPRRAVVVGAGPEADRLVTAMLIGPAAAPVPVVVLDDDPRNVGRAVGGLAVSGSTADLGAAAARAGAGTVVLATPSADSITIQSLMAQAAAAGLELLVLPPPSEVGDTIEVGRLRSPTAEDLYARDPVAVDDRLLAAEITGRRVLVVGAAGAIGAPLATLLLGLQPAALVLVDHDGNGLRHLQLTLGRDGAAADPALALADVRDRERVFELFERHRPEVVFHAAGLSHRSLVQNEPIEAIKTNTVGSKNLLDAAVHVAATTFVHLSSGAAADPSSVIGATKLSAERLTALAAAETGWRYISVRTASVFDGRGSAVAAFRRQLATGRPLTVPHRDVTQLLLSAAEAARLVLLAAAVGAPGEVLVVDAGYPVRLFDLARHVSAEAEDAPLIEEAGPEPGQALHTVLFGPNEIGVTGRHPRVVHLPAERRDPCPALAEATGVSEATIRSMVSAGPRLRLVRDASLSHGGNQR